MIGRYLDALNALGSLRIHGSQVRELLRDDNTDLWGASSIRESSLWTDPLFFERLDGLIKNVSIRDVPTSRFRNRFQVFGSWSRALIHAIFSRKPTSSGDVVLVEYLSPSYPIGDRGESPYFGHLPRLLADTGVSWSFLHIHSEGPVTCPTSTVRKIRRRLAARGISHVFLSDYLNLTVWIRAFLSWRMLTKQAPTSKQIEEAIPKDSDLERLWSSWRTMYEESVRGPHSIRTSLLSAMLCHAVQASRESRLWLSAFEGQGWEACLARSLDQNGVEWVPYLHTMMRPWDLRARTFLREVRPRQVAVHGKHDLAELASVHGSFVEVEALRYANLAKSSTSVETTTNSERYWLIVGGAECERSNSELENFLWVHHSLRSTRKLVVKWHPQCGRPTSPLPSNVTLSEESIAQLVNNASVALMVGSAAPLDTYLSGVPSCSMQTPSGFAMSPLEEGEYFHVADDAFAALQWMQSAEGKPMFSAPVGDYFNLDSAYPRWRKFLMEQLTT